MLTGCQKKGGHPLFLLSRKKWTISDVSNYNVVRLEISGDWEIRGQGASILVD